MLKRFSSTASIALVLFASACSEHDQPQQTLTAPALDAVSTAAVSSITVSPSSATISVGQTLAFTATASPAGSATKFSWASSNRTVARFNSTGVLVTFAAGTTTVTATADGVTGKAVITVTASSTPAAVFVGAGDI